MIQIYENALAQMAVRVGANVQPDQVVIIDSDVGKEAVARAVAQCAYAAGAKYVDIVVNDRRHARVRALSAEPGSLSYVPPWIADRYAQLAELGGAWIRLAGPVQTSELNGVDPALSMLVAPPVAPGVVDVVNQGSTNWTVVPAPSASWAALVHPDLGDEDALRQLWQEVAHTCRLDLEDTVAAWRKRIGTLQRVAAWLSNGRWDAIHLTGPGTDLTVGLMPTSRWSTAGQQTATGIEHLANLPSEEVFTAPDPARVDGTVSTTRPILVSGVTVSGLRLTFRDGEVTSHTADHGAEIIAEVLARDAGARRLGELALVDASGRIGELGVTFHETLLDENAASHIALGSAFPFCVESDEDRSAINRSEMHVDLMIGSRRLEVDGIAADGSHTPLLRDGVWTGPA